MEYDRRPQTSGGYSSVKRGASTRMRRQQSLEAFPLPPRSSLSTFKRPEYTKSQPDLHRTFRFPSVPSTPERFRTPSPPIGRPPIEQTLKEVTTLIHGRAISPPKQLTPLQYERPPSGIPFADFSTWDLDDEDEGSDQDGEELILPHSGWPTPTRTTQRKTSEHMSAELDQYALAQEKARILQETKIAEKAVVDAGFDFGFTAPLSVEKFDLEPVSPLSGGPNPLFENPVTSPLVNTHPVDEEAIPGVGVALPLSRAESTQFSLAATTPLSPADSAVSINSRPISGKKESIYFLDKQYHDFGAPPPSRAGSMCAKKSWCLMPACDQKQEALKERKDVNKIRTKRCSRSFGSAGDFSGGVTQDKSTRKKRLGFWGKMKSTVSLRKNTTVAAR